MFVGQHRREVASGMCCIVLNVRVVSFDINFIYLDIITVILEEVPILFLIHMLHLHAFCRSVHQEVVVLTVLFCLFWVFMTWYLLNFHLVDLITYLFPGGKLPFSSWWYLSKLIDNLSSALTESSSDLFCRHRYLHKQSMHGEVGQGEYSDFPLLFTILWI